MKPLIHILLAWTFLIAGFNSQRESAAPFIPAPAQFTFAERADCLETHRQFHRVGFVTLPYDLHGVPTCWSTETKIETPIAR